MKLFFLTLLSLGVFAPAMLAQTAAPDGLSGDSSSNEVFSGSGVDFYDLVHRAGRGTVSPTDFSRQQQRRIPNAVEDFRLRQQDALQQQATGESAVDVIDVDETVISE